MSHFTVLVSAKDEDHMESKLEAYIEQTEDEGLREKYFVFNDTTDEYKGKFEIESTEQYLHGKEWVFRWEATTRNLEPDKLKKRTIRFNKLYKTFEEFCKEWEGSELNEEGRCGYTHNPNAKWDWYSIGGRWSGLLKVKSILDKANGRSKDSEKEKPLNSFDYCKKGNLNAELIKEEKYKKAKEQYLLYKEIKEKFPDLKDSRKLLLENFSWDFEFDKLDKISLEEYCESESKSALTFAILTDKWYEKGKMGWWACVSDENEYYNTDFWDIFNKIDDNDMIYVIDCHI